MIKIEKINREEALRYLSCSDEKSIGSTAAEIMDQCEKMLLEVIAPKLVYRYFTISSSSDNKVTLEGTPLVLTGKDITNHLAGCSGAVLIAATIGPGADRLIRRLQVEDMAKAVITDAFASCAAEQVCEYAEDLIKNEFEGKYFTWRYAPGYGDLPIDIQKIFLDVTDAQRKAGICTSDSRMLTPIKSVTSVMGISEKPVPTRARGCVTCNMREVCNFRKRGMHCGS